MKTFLILAAAALSVSGIASAASDTRSVTVRYGDLNLNSKAGIASLHKRIRNAAESACAPLESRILGLDDAYEACVTDALNRGIAAVGNDNLSNYHLGKAQRVVASVR
jgi:UrcA family protein